MKIPMDKRNPKMVFVCAVAAIAGIICTGIDLPMKPFVALTAFGMLRATIASQGDTTPAMISPMTHT